jgi:hypothetical protein
MGDIPLTSSPPHSTPSSALTRPSLHPVDSTLKLMYDSCHPYYRPVCSHIAIPIPVPTGSHRPAQVVLAPILRFSESFSLVEPSMYAPVTVTFLP